MDGIVKKDRMVDFQDGKGAVPTSLFDLGYNDVVRAAFYFAIALFSLPAFFSLSGP
jgi:hypothetical protein